MTAPAKKRLAGPVTGLITICWHSLTKQGTGTWNSDEALNAPIATNVQAGVLLVNSTLNTPVVNVRAEGTLGGSGTISGSVINAGTVAPGTLALSGDYTQTANGILLIGVAGTGAGQHGLLAVGGHATVGGTLQIKSLGNFSLAPGDQITFLTANNGVSGAFNTTQNGLVTTGTIVQATVTTTPGSASIRSVAGFLHTHTGSHLDIAPVRGG